MSRIRTIKPDLWINPRFACCSPHARLLFLGMLNFADDWGRHPAEPLALKMAILPNDHVDVAPLVEELCTAGLVGQYQTESGEFLQVLGFLRHQRVDRRKEPRWPEPTPDNQTDGETPSARWDLFYENLSGIKNRRRIDDGSTTNRGARNDESHQISAEGKGREGIGKDQGRDRKEGREQLPPSRSLFPTQKGKFVELRAGFLNDLEARYTIPVVEAQLRKYSDWVAGSENGVKAENVEEWLRSKMAEDLRQGGGRGGGRNGGVGEIDEQAFLAAVAEGQQ